MSRPGHTPYAAAVVAHTWTNQDGVFRASIRTPDGQHHTVTLPFTAEDLVGRRVRLVAGAWALEAAVSA